MKSREHINTIASFIVVIFALLSLAGCLKTSESTQIPSDTMNSSEDPVSLDTEEAHEGNVTSSVDIESDFINARFQLLKDSARVPDWCTDDYIEYCQSLVDELASGMQPAVVYFSLADITEDGIPEIFIGYYGRWNRRRADYVIYSYVDKEVMVPNPFLYDDRTIEMDMTDIYMSPTLSEDPCYPLFRGTYYIDSEGNKYYLCYSPSGNATHETYKFTRLDYKDGKLSSTSWETLAAEFSITDQWFAMVTATVAIESNTDTSLDSLVLKGICDYIETATNSWFRLVS